MSRQMAAHDSLASSGPTGSLLHTGTGPWVPPPPCGISPGMAAPQNNTIPPTGNGTLLYRAISYSATGPWTNHIQTGPGKGDSAPLHHSRPAASRP